MPVVVARDLVAGVADEAGDDERGQRIEDRQPEPRAGQRGDHGQRRPHVAARLHRVGQQHLAAEPLGLARLVATTTTRLTPTVTSITTKLGDRDLERRRPPGQVVEGVAQHLDDDEQQEQR